MAADLGVHGARRLADQVDRERVELAPDVATFQNNLGVALERAGYPTQAADAFKAALAVDEKYEKARISLERVSPKVTTSETPVDLTALAADFAAEVTRWQAEGRDVREERDDLPGGYHPEG